MSRSLRVLKMAAIHAMASIVFIVLHGCGSGGPATPTPTPQEPTPTPQAPTPRPTAFHELCSKEICAIVKEGQKVQLDAQTYYLDKQIHLPRGAQLVGAGIGKTIIVASGDILGTTSRCRGRNSCRRGFLLNDDTYVGRFTFRGRDSGRWGDNGILYGGAPIETPGCGDSYCETPDGGQDFCTGNDCNGISNATAEDILVETFTTQNVVWVPMTPNGKRTCSNLHFNRLSAEGTWADGVNIHGAHRDVLVENSVIRHSQDDGFALWSDSDKETNIIFQNNIMEYPRLGGLPSESDCEFSNCFAMYGGGRGTKFLNNSCTSTYQALVKFQAAFHGEFSADAMIVVQGNTVKSGKGQGAQCCSKCPVCWWESSETSPLPEVSEGDCKKGYIVD